MANACVSHEMRNPLNAITAVDQVKKAAYNEIKEMLSEERNIQIGKVISKVPDQERQWAFY